MSATTGNPPRSIIRPHPKFNPETRTTHILLEGIVGSVAYGLNTPDSDIDYTGIYAEPTSAFLGLHPPARERATWKRDDPDTTFHEVGKAMGLMLSCNPTASEILWLDHHQRKNAFGEELIGLRTAFLCRKRVRDAYFGFATSQFKRLLSRGRFAGSLETRREKHARHTMRLLWQGYELYTTGHLPIRVPDPQPFFDFGASIKADPEAKAANSLIVEYSQKFDAAVSPLPEHPDEAPIEDFMQRVRRHYLEDIAW
ncbi:nucleotidyltransferase domain-containing protein [Rhodococcoides fascians]|uniref:nucleotidyltransferase domain-containing protein n=1 Tax=Rhodococcoides fascians TaxID=1828 RepID=UPI0009B80DB7|nr:nucleotidyltransferase domain-containing protein [Rhodococcus fascians]